MGGMLRIPMAHVVLHGPQMRAFVGEVVAVGMPNYWARHTRSSPTFSPARHDGAQLVARCS